MTDRSCRFPFATLLLALAASVLAGPVWAWEYQCTLPGDTRFVRVDIPTEDYLCEVAVTYQSSGERRVMWYAQNSTAFCFGKAEELVRKYVEQWNFECSRWPDHDGVARLDDDQRDAFDRDLLQIRDQQPEDDLNAARVASSDDGEFLAIQYFIGDKDLVRLFSRSNGSWQRIAEFDDLGSHVVADVPIDAAMLAGVDDQASLRVLTTVSPSGGNGRNCRGVQELATTLNDSSLHAVSPHRFSCDPG